MFNKKSIILIVIAIIIVFCISYIILNKNDNQNNNNENNYKKENFNSNDNIEFEVDSNDYRINKSIFYNGDLLTLLSNLKKNNNGTYSNYNPITKSEYDEIVTKIEDISPVYFENKAFAGKFRNKNKLFSSFLSSDSSEFNVSNNINYSTNKCFFELESSGNNKKIKLHGQNKYISGINNNNFEFTDDNNEALEFAISDNNIKIISNDNEINNKFLALVYDPNSNNTKIQLKDTANNNDDECIFFIYTRFDIILFENNIEKEYEKGNNIGYGNRTEINGIPIGYYQTDDESNITELFSGCYRNLNMNLKLNFFSNNNPYEGLIENNEEFTNRQYTNILKDNYHVLKDLKYLLISRTNDIISNNENMIDKILLFYEQNKKGYFFMLENGKNSKKIYEQDNSNSDIKTASLNQLKLEDFKVKSIFIDKYHEIVTDPGDLPTDDASFNSLTITTYPKDSNMRLPRENSACSNIYSPLSNIPKDAKNNKDCRLECIKENDCRVSEYDGNKKEKNCKLYKTCGTNFIDKQNSLLNFMDIENFTNSNNSKSLPSNYKSSNLEETFTNYLKEDFTTYYSPVDEKNRVRYNLDCNEEENTNQNTSTIELEETMEENMTNYYCSLKCNNTDNCNFYSFKKGDNINTCKLYSKCNYQDDLIESENTKLQCKIEEDCRNFKFPDTHSEAAQKTEFQELSNSVGDVRQPVNISINETDYLMGSNYNYNEINKSGMFKNINNEIETIKR